MSRQAAAVKRRFPAGTKIRLWKMEGEPDMPAGLMGEVVFVDDLGQVDVNWQNGRNLSLDIHRDSFDVVSTPCRDKGMSR